MAANISDDDDRTDSLYVWRLEQTTKKQHEQIQGLNTANWFWQLLFVISFVGNVAFIIGTTWS